MPTRKKNPMQINSCLVWGAITLIIAPGCVYAASAQTGDAPALRVNRVLAQTPLIDGHNDLAWQIRDCFGSLENLDLRADTAHLPKPANAAADCEWTPLMTDIPR